MAVNLAELAKVRKNLLCCRFCFCWQHFSIVCVISDNANNSTQICKIWTRRLWFDGIKAPLLSENTTCNIDRYSTLKSKHWWVYLLQMLKWRRHDVVRVFNVNRCLCLNDHIWLLRPSIRNTILIHVFIYEGTFCYNLDVHEDIHCMFQYQLRDKNRPDTRTTNLVL